MMTDKVFIEKLVENCDEMVAVLNKMKLTVEVLLGRVLSLEQKYSLVEETVQSLNEEMTDLEGQVIEIDDRVDTLEQIDEASE